MRSRQVISSSSTFDVAVEYIDLSWRRTAQDLADLYATRSYSQGAILVEAMQKSEDLELRIVGLGRV